MPAYGPESYRKSGVPEGKLSEKIVHTSKIYDGMQTNYWIYVPAQYDPATLMVWQDGDSRIRPNDAYRVLITTGNLMAEKKIPVMIQVLIQPGLLGDKKMRHRI